MGIPKENLASCRIQVLIIGMLDSVHLARWLVQFSDENIDFVIVASKKYRKLHPLTISLLNSNHLASYTLAQRTPLKSISGYSDFLQFELGSRFKFFGTRAKSLARVIGNRNFHFIHALEIQGAGYLLNDLNTKLLKKQKVILTNWGSDIYFYMRLPEHEGRIRSVLPKANYYSAECVRDYALAREYGFVGEELPCIPNAGGFEIEIRDHNFVPPTQRNQILIKGYGGTFGRADLPISLIPIIAAKYPEISFHIYSVTNDTLGTIHSLPSEILSRIRISKVQNRLPHSEMLDEFSKSRIYIGCSESDGISTSFIESLIYGTYPIQTSTSCANEWVDRGAMASIIGLDSDSLLNEIQNALDDDKMVEAASIANFEVARKFLDSDVVKSAALQFYDLAD
jgi:hypothetical protein